MFSADRWRHKGHPLGQCIISPDGELCFVCIPKNSSSYWDTWLVNELGWTKHFNSLPSANTKIIVPLRDPCERWISGISEYFMLYHQNYYDNFTTMDGFVNLVEDRVVFDDHTECQSYFLADFNLEDAVYFNSNNTEIVWQFLESQGHTRPNKSWLNHPINFTDDPVNANRKKWKTFFVNNIDLNNIRSYYNTYDKFAIQKLKELNEQ